MAIRYCEECRYFDQFCGECKAKPPVPVTKGKIGGRIHYEYPKVDPSREACCDAKA